MAKSIAEMACAKLDAKIAELQREIDGLERSKDIIRAGDEPAEAPKTRKQRGPNKRRGLPAGTSDPASVV